jgi:hypothetical protein
MSEQAYQPLLSSLDEAVEILSCHRTPDPAMIAAFDTLKQARAKIVGAIQDASLAPVRNPQLEAA